MADQTLSPSGSPAKIEIPANVVPGKRAVLYTCVSTGEQHPETQLYDLRELAKQRRFEIVHEYTDTISGAKSKRPGLDQLLADGRRHRFDVVLVAAFDKVARNVRHFLEVLDELNHQNIEFVSLRENIDTGGPLGHLSDSFRAALGEKRISQSTTLFKRTIYKWVALWLPFHWPHGIKTRPEMDQHQGGTPPAEFASDLEKLRILFNRFCTSEVEFAPHATLGQMSRSECMRHAYLHMDHHLRQFGA
jgi:hypothetical protein